MIPKFTCCISKGRTACRESARRTTTFWRRTAPRTAAVSEGPAAAAPLGAARLSRACPKNVSPETFVGSFVGSFVEIPSFRAIPVDKVCRQSFRQRPKSSFWDKLYLVRASCALAHATADRCRMALFFCQSFFCHIWLHTGRKLEAESWRAERLAARHTQKERLSAEGRAKSGM